MKNGYLSYNSFFNKLSNKELLEFIDYLYGEQDHISEVISIIENVLESRGLNG